MPTPTIAGFTSGHADVGGTRLHYWVGGAPEGPAVLLWHGFLGTGYSWRKVMAPLARAGCAVLVPDMRGYGDSDKPAGSAGYDGRALAEEMRALRTQIAFAAGRPLTLVGFVLVRDGHFPTRRPFVRGFEAAGQIVAVGEGIDEGRVGESVVALTSGGAYAERVVAPAALTLSIGDLPIRTAGGFGWITPAAYDLINTVTRVQPGEGVLVHAAAGGVGTLAAQFAELAGAEPLVGVVGTPDQADYAMQFGYDQVLVQSEFPAQITGETFDVILDPIGGPTRQFNLNLLAPHGRIAIYGNIATFEPVLVSTNDLLMEGKSVLTYNSNLLSQTHPARLAASARRALEQLVIGQVRIDITAEFDLSELATAVQRLSHGHTHGKSVLRIHD